jgi:hypothetical protein
MTTEVISWELNPTMRNQTWTRSLRRIKKVYPDIHEYIRPSRPCSENSPNQLQLQYNTTTYNYNQYDYTTIQLQLQLQLQLHCATLHHTTYSTCGWGDHCNHLKKTQLHPPFGPLVDLLCHPCVTTTHLSCSVLSLSLPPPPCAALLVSELFWTWVFTLNMDII